MYCEVSKSHSSSIEYLVQGFLLKPPGYTIMFTAKFEIHGNYIQLP